MKKLSSMQFIYLIWLAAIAGVVGSLYFELFLHLQPCVLCWVQRIFLYPVALITPVGILRKDLNVVRYLLPLLSLGWVVSFYHMLLQAHIIPEAAAPCVNGVPCVTNTGIWFGFLSIPMMSWFAFSAMLIAAIIVLRRKEQHV